MKYKTNSVHLEGRVYQHSLEEKVVKRQDSPNFGKPFIAGKIEIAVDEAGMNIIPVEFSYVTEMTKKGNKNNTYAELLKIIKNGKTWEGDGKDAATMVKIDTSLDINDFVASDDTMVSQVILSGGFLTVVGSLNPDENKRNTFKIDMLISSTAEVEREGIEPYTALRGYAFNFREAVLPVEFIVRDLNGRAYFSNEDISNNSPLYTCVAGVLNFKNISTPKVEDTAFGSMVEERNVKVKEWIVTTAKKVPYEFGDPEVLTANDIQKGLQDREVHLAEVRKSREEYLANKDANTISGFTTPVASVPTPSTGPAAPQSFSF